MAASSVGGWEAAWCLVRLGECGCTPPGMNSLRLTQAGRSLVTRVAVLK